jgi:hypothetical protein
MRLIMGALLLCALASPSAVRAQDEHEGQCFPPELLIAKARTERPSTRILARHTGSDAAAFVDAMNELATGGMQEGSALAEVPEAGEVTVLRSAQSDAVLLLGAEQGCLVWRGEVSRSQYEHAIWKAFGLPV